MSRLALLQSVISHRPAGYTVHVRKMKNCNGLASFQRTITIDKDLRGGAAIFTFLHECGHVHSKHLRKSARGLPLWRVEFEADQYAIKAMKKIGTPIPRATAAHHKQLMREYVEAALDKDHTTEIDEDVLRYAYGRAWRKSH